jgi:hypothetical protein
MLTRSVELLCWVCGESFQGEEPRSYTVSGRGSDLCPRPIGGNPLALLIHVCPTCGFAGDGRAFAPEEADEQIRQWVLGGGAAAVPTDGGAAHLRYERAALCHAHRQRPSPLQMFEYYVAASWSAQIEEVPEAARGAQVEAAHHLEQALLAGEVANEERAIMNYLAGELHRRTGDFKVALQLFDESAIEFTRHGGPKWLISALGQQAGLAKRESTESAELAE